MSIKYNPALRSFMRSTRSAGPGILWITNAAPPYRRGVWRAISAELPVRVALLESNSRLGRDARRGEDWRSDNLDVEVFHPRVWRLARGERVLYTLLSRILQRNSRPRAILLGGWESPAYWQALLSAKMRRIRVVGFYESTLLTNRHSRGPIAWARRRFFRIVDGVVVPGPAAREAVYSFGVPPSRVFEGFNAVDVEHFYSGSAERERPTSSGHRFVYVGQLIGRKNLLDLIDGFAHARHAGDSLTLVGSGDQRAQLLAHVVDLGLEQSVRFHKPIPNDELPRLLSSFDTLVLPSSEEVWGLVVNEALASRLHAIVSRQAGVYDSVNQMRGVFPTDPDAKSIAAAMAVSRAEWQGPIARPEILMYTPERFASVFLNALVGESSLES